ncbi:S-adenosylmethionine:tRNA ribosyltransferase-isomerase [Lewinella sp. 4G2]|uniref:S-adenosylmethionine:tRNA ribosyltransferase-isomerase n=1 Tax=Lewinella sp. 4G2 TaxID=1803372 RepID=UPI0007E0C83A|nr:S-adenosylmethionine:tRNA ribosyltransferase-isomerase [Lewinella sp. 4G2]OAV44270.1 S-adenosylmethionine tRNA ribosyltransferase [Lewinella sp. 4G2]
MLTTARDISIDTFDYDLPDERIARHPVARRDAAKQLIWHGTYGTHKIATVADFPRQLPPGSLVVGNNTRVIHARLFFPLAEGKRPIEIFCLDPLVPVDHAQNLGARTQVQWKCLIGGNRRWKRGALTLDVPLNQGSAQLMAERIERQEGTFTVAFSWSSTKDANYTFGEILEAAGTLPLPPYLGRETEAADEERYQTVFARTEGSVAAPTAGLHFTPAVMADMKERGIGWGEVLLHVGAGTFRPVSTPTLGGHDMHRETFSVTLELLDRLIANYESGKPVVAVGTTTLRCLESLHCLGAESLQGTREDGSRDFTVDQWAFEDEFTRTAAVLDTFTALRGLMEREALTVIGGQTEVLLSPVSGVRTVSALMTNFHQPKSTLLLIIAAIVGEDWRKLYQVALEQDFRFLSYGDSCLLWNK